MARAVKEATVAELTERFNNASGAVLTEYRGLTVAQVQELRQALGKDASFSVVKNTLTKIAAKDAGITADFSQLLVGPSAIAFVDGDVVQAAKGLREFSKANPLLVIKGGVLDGKMMTPTEITKLADLESRDVLLAKLAGAFKATMAGAAATFAALPVQMARLMAALEEKKAAEGPAASDAAPVEDAAPVRRRRSGGGRGSGRGCRSGGRLVAPRIVQPQTDPRPDVQVADHEVTAQRKQDGGSTTMAKLSSGDLLDAFKEMTLIELSEFVKEFEETFDVKAAAPVAMAGAPAAGGGGAAAEEVEEQDEFERHP